MGQSIITNAFIASFGRVINVGLGVVVIALITRALGPARYGSYVLVLSVGAILQLVADFGLYLTLTREVAREPQRQSEIVSGVTLIRLILLAGSFLAGLILLFFIPGTRELLGIYVVVYVGLVAQSISQLFMGIYQYRQVVWRATIGDITGRFIQIAAILLMAQKDISVKGAAFAFMLGGLVSLVVHYYLLSGIKWRFQFRWGWVKKILVMSWPLGAMLVLNAIYFRVDMVILSLFRTGEELGWYGVAYRAVESLLFFPAMLGGLLLPRISEAIALRKRSEVCLYIKEGLYVLLTSAALVGVVLFAYSKYIILLIAGSGYGPAANILSLLGVALVIMFVGNLFGYTMVAYRQQKFLLRLYLGLVFFNVIANMIFVPSYGAIAAASTTIVTELLAMGITGWWVVRKTKVSVPYSLMIRLGLIIAITVVFTAIFPVGVPISMRILGTITLFMGLVFLTKTLQAKHIIRLSGGVFE